MAESGCRSRQPVDRLAFFLLKDMGRAVREFHMIRSGDRIAAAISGGKDSLTLLRLLMAFRRRVQTPFELAAIHVCGDGSGTTAPHEPLVRWLENQKVPFLLVEPDLSGAECLPLKCHRCTWLRRKALFEAASRLGCNVLAYAHHADDVAQTTLLNLLYGGVPRTLAPHADYFGGEFRLIRPLIYVPESELARFARADDFPPPPPECPRAGASRRRIIADMLKLLGRDYRIQARNNLLYAGLRETNRQTVLPLDEKSLSV